MISFLGYNFCSDGNSIDPIPTDVNNVINTQIQAGTFSHLHVSKNIDKEPTFNIPLEWDVDTIMDCNFDDNISAGSVTRIISDIDKIIIRRTPVGTYDWITIKVLDIKNDPSSLGGAFVDALTANGVEYEYQFIPVLGDLEGTPITETILSNFKGVFLCDSNTAFRMYYGVSFGDTTTNQQIGTFTPYGRRYPVVVSNALTNYQTGSVSTRVVPADFEATRYMDGRKVAQAEKALQAFLTNKKPKVLKDDNGREWLCIITTTPTISYDNNYGRGAITVDAGWTEIGDANSEDDLQNAGLIPKEG